MCSPSSDSKNELTFDDFKNLARDNSLSPYEKIGFPISYREGKEELIFVDIVNKLTNLKLENQVVVDIGSGCSGPAFMMIEFCRHHKHHLLLVDSEEMLSHLPNEPFVTKIAGRYPDQCNELLAEYGGRVNAIICYSVLHYIYVESNVFEFIDYSLDLLAEGGQMLIGDIPNISKRRRFFSSPAGIQFHKDFTRRDELPGVEFNRPTHGKIDDSVLIGLVTRARNSGSDAYLLPQPPDLPMANRREDLFIQKP